MPSESESSADPIGADPAMQEPEPDDSGLRAQTYKIALSGAVALVACATVFYKLLEDWSWVDAFYFSSVAVTTVGFGDLAPSTDATKLFTVFYIFAGISLIGVVLNERLRRRTIHRHERRSNPD